MPIRGILGRQRNCSVLLATVSGVDLVGRHVLTDKGPIPYDRLVLATGAHHSYFAHPEWEADARGIKTVDDATSLRGKILLAFERAGP